MPSDPRDPGLDAAVADDSDDAAELASVERVAHAMRHVWYALTRNAETPEQLAGLHKQAFWVLGSLVHGPRRMSELAEATELSSAHITGIVDKLEERDLAVRSRSEEDRRVITVTITPKGREGMLEASRGFATRLETVLAPLTEAERVELARLLAKMTEGKAPRD